MKKHFKKFIAVLAAIFSLTLTAFGCGEVDNGNQSDLPNLIIGVSAHEPYFYIDANGNYSGIDIEIAKLACEKIGYNPVFKRINWIEKDAALNSGEVDCVMSCFSMNGRENLYKWAGPYAIDREVIAVLDDSNIRSFNDLVGKKLAVQMTSKAEELFVADDNVKLPKIKSVFSLKDLNESVAALRRGYVDACAGHEAALENKLKELSVNYRILDETLMITSLGVAFPLSYQGDVHLKLNVALNKMKNDGTIGAIFTSYGAKTYGV